MVLCLGWVELWIHNTFLKRIWGRKIYCEVVAHQKKTVSFVLHLL